MGADAVCRRICTITQRMKQRPANPHAPTDPLRVKTVCPGVVRRAASSRTAPKCTTVGVLKARMVATEASGSAITLASPLNATTTNIRPVRAAAEDPVMT